jgi:hypothetical protein
MDYFTGAIFVIVSVAVISFIGSFFGLGILGSLAVYFLFKML